MRHSLSAWVVFSFMMTAVVTDMFGHVPVVSGDSVDDGSTRTSLWDSQESNEELSAKSVDMAPGDAGLRGGTMCEIPKPSWIGSAADDGDVHDAAAATDTDAGPTYFDGDNAVASSSQIAGDDAGDTDSTNHSTGDEHTSNHTEKGEADAEGEAMTNTWASKRMVSPLKVGQSMKIEHRLTSTDGGSEVVLSHEGSLHFRDSPSSSRAFRPPRDARDARSNDIEEQDSKLSNVLTKIFVAKPQKVAQVFTMRAAYDEFQEIQRTAEGKVLREEKSLRGWYHRHRAHSFNELKDTVGKVEMTVSDRGCVEVVVDDTRVVSRSGRFKRDWMNRFPWRRRKSEDYEVHATEDGLEVRLGDKAVWGVRAAKPTKTDRTAAKVGDDAPLPPGERTVWGIKASDIFD